MPELSPAAQAVLDAVVFSKPGLYSGIAAALRAAADQVVPKLPEPRFSTDAEQARWFACDDVRDELLAIAAELEGR